MAKKTGEKYEQIIDAAVKVIARHGYHNAQVAKIAKEAQVADGTIYLYFENKEDVLISLFQNKMGHFIEQVKKEIDQVNTAEEKLFQLIYMHFKQLADYPELAIVTQIELRQSNLEIRRSIGKILKRYHEVIDDLLKFGISTGVFKPEIDVRITRRIIFGAIDETVSSWIMNEMKYDLISLVRPIHYTLLHGIAK